MPYRIEIDLDQGRAIFEATGGYSQDDALRSIQDRIGHPDFLLTKIGASRWAFVATRDYVHGLARMYQTMMEDTPIEVEIFHDVKTAKAWLDDR